MSAVDSGVEPSPDEDEYVAWEKAVHGSFLVAAYRRPEFRVDITIATEDGTVTGQMYVLWTLKRNRPA